MTATVKEGELQKCHMWNINVSFRITPQENVTISLILIFIPHIYSIFIDGFPCSIEIWRGTRQTWSLFQGRMQVISCRNMAIKEVAILKP